MKIGVGLNKRFSCLLLLLLVLLSEEEQALSPRRSVLIKRAPVPVIRPGFERGVETASACSTDLGVIRADLHFYFVNRLDRRNNNRTIPHISDRYTFDQVVVPPARAAAQTEQ